MYLACEDKDWTTVRRELTDEKIKLIYLLYGIYGRRIPISYNCCRSLTAGCARSIPAAFIPMPSRITRLAHRFILVS